MGDLRLRNWTTGLKVTSRDANSPLTFCARRSLEGLLRGEGFVAPSLFARCVSSVRKRCAFGDVIRRGEEKVCGGAWQTAAGATSFRRRGIIMESGGYKSEQNIFSNQQDNRLR